MLNTQNVLGTGSVVGPKNKHFVSKNVFVIKAHLEMKIK